jgi:hypothetical protein
MTITIWKICFVGRKGNWMASTIHPNDFPTKDAGLSFMAEPRFNNDREEYRLIKFTAEVDEHLGMTEFSVVDQDWVEAVRKQPGKYNQLTSMPRDLLAQKPSLVEETVKMLRAHAIPQ